MPGSLPWTSSSTFTASLEHCRPKKDSASVRSFGEPRLRSRRTSPKGHSRIGGGEFRRFVSIARGSGAEVETQIAVAVALGLIVGDEITFLSSKLDRLSKMLFSLYRSLAT